MLPSEMLPLALVVDYDDAFRCCLCRALANRQWQTVSAASADEALLILQDRSPDLVLIDPRTPEGVELVQQLRSTNSSTTIIVLTGFGNNGLAADAMKHGADACLNKPADADQILSLYRIAVRFPA
jgi:ActR/RegA family two-component response regulator